MCILMYWKVASNIWACLCEWTQAHTWLQVTLPEEDDDISHLVATQMDAEEIISQLVMDKQLSGYLTSRNLSTLLSDGWISSNVIDVMLEMVPGSIPNTPDLNHSIIIV